MSKGHHPGPTGTQQAPADSTHRPHGSPHARLRLIFRKHGFCRLKNPHCPPLPLRDQARIPPPGPGEASGWPCSTSRVTHTQPRGTPAVPQKSHALSPLGITSTSSLQPEPVPLGPSRMRHPAFRSAPPAGHLGPASAADSRAPPKQYAMLLLIWIPRSQNYVLTSFQTPSSVNTHRAKKKLAIGSYLLIQPVAVAT